MEIGSEFWLDSVPREHSGNIPEWIDKFGNTVLTSCCRGAISLLLDEIQPKARTALLPGYTCDSVIQPFVAQGYDCHFYDVNMDLTPDPDSIAAYDNVGVFLHMGYFGFPTNIGLFSIVKQFKAESTIVVEDITHALFSELRRFAENDYYAASLRKWVGIPSGGFLASENRPIKGVMQENEAFADTRREALLMKARYIDDGDATLKPRYLESFAKGEAYIDNDPAPYYIDALSKTIIGRLDVDQLKGRRRTNFMTLLEGLKDVENIQPVFAEVPYNICPLFFPVYIESDRDGIRQRLIDNDIYCAVHWPITEQVERSRLANMSRINNTILSIPCDQRYTEEDMERVLLLLKT
jgi:hypothetical protein